MGGDIHICVFSRNPVLPRRAHDDHGRSEDGTGAYMLPAARRNSASQLGMSRFGTALAHMDRADEGDVCLDLCCYARHDMGNSILAIASHRRAWNGPSRSSHKKCKRDPRRRASLALRSITNSAVKSTRTESYSMGGDATGTRLGNTPNILRRRRAMAASVQLTPRRRTRSEAD